MTEKRYDTLVIEGATAPTVPREVEGARVVSWAAGHAIAEQFVLEEFVRDLAQGAFDCLTVGGIMTRAEQALADAVKAREEGHQ